MSQGLHAVNRVSTYCVYLHCRPRCTAVTPPPCEVVPESGEDYGRNLRIGRRQGQI